MHVTALGEVDIFERLLNFVIIALLMSQHYFFQLFRNYNKLN
jgi:hypothetical protein